MTTGAKSPERTVKILKLSFILYSALLMFKIYRVPPTTQAPANSAFELIITVIALTDVAIGLLAPRFLSKFAGRPSSTSPRITPERQWITRCILSLAFFLSCNFFALVLHYTGAHAYLVWSLFAVGTLALILWSPGKPPAVADGAITQF